MLKFPPIKQKQIPSSLIYQNITHYGSHRIRQNYMFDTKTGELQAVMRYIPAIISRDNSIVKSLYISYLSSYKIKHGYGSKMLNFAKYCSKKEDCNGFVHLKADFSFLPEAVPHVFYRKMGMNSGDKILDKKLDKLIKEGKNGSYNDIPCSPMYYPPISYPKKHNKYLDFIKRIFRFD